MSLINGKSRQFQINLDYLQPHLPTCFDPDFVGLSSGIVRPLNARGANVLASIIIFCDMALIFFSLLLEVMSITCCYCDFKKEPARSRKGSVLIWFMFMVTGRRNRAKITSQQHV